ncbi:MAG: hypothetical protein LHW64_10535 [Candidatus Cloacimonetes bacterium]|nr:hypothetical protein [Candidatus Cloacimonadota bacterium]MDY0230548.1 hypothetical protein [Candidatus Cloacimonadaceae bacterium]
MSLKKLSHIFPVPINMFEDNTNYKIYIALLNNADDTGRVTLSNIEISKIIGVSETSTSVTTGVNILKSMGVVERIKKSSRAEKIGFKRILQLKPPYDKLALVFQKQGSIHPLDFLEKMRNL